MTVEQFFHVCRSAAAVGNVVEVTVFGAAAVVPWAAEVAGSDSWPSMELDIDAGDPPTTDLIDGSIGEGSLFSETFGVYAHGVGIEAFVAPSDWPVRARTFVDPVSGVRVRAPHPLDLAVAKLVRGDQRDWAFAEYVMRHFGATARQLEHGLRAAAQARPPYAQQCAFAATSVRARFGGPSTA